RPPRGTRADRCLQPTPSRLRRTRTAMRPGHGGRVGFPLPLPRDPYSEQEWETGNPSIFVLTSPSISALVLKCQGYRDSGFSQRVLWYHIGFAVRYRGRRRVRTVALWLIPLPSTQPRNEVAAGDITVKVTTIVLPEVPASCLLSDPATACFAVGSDAEGR